MRKTEQATCEAIRRNIEAVAAMDERYLSNRRTADRVADAFAAFSGSMTLVLLYIFIYSAWILINLKQIPSFRPSTRIRSCSSAW